MLQPSTPTSSPVRRSAGVALLLVYVASILASNWLTTRYGLISVFPGLYATAGTVAVGGVIMTRDFLQDALGRAAVLAAIATGAGLSWALSSHQIAVASGVTFLAAETLEFAVYTPLRRRYGWGTSRWGGVIGLANATGAIADTLLFLALARFPLTGPVIAGQLLGKAYVTAAVVLAAWLIRRATHRSPQTAGMRLDRAQLRDAIRDAVTVDIPGDGPVCKLTDTELNEVLLLADGYGAHLVEEYAHPNYLRASGHTWQPQPAPRRVQAGRAR